jgi:hypothetical protein
MDTLPSTPEETIPLVEGQYTEEEKLEMLAMAEKWSPIVYHHPDEKYYPVSIDWLMANSVLLDYTESPPFTVSPITNQAIYDLAMKHRSEIKTNGDILFSFGKELHRGEQPTRNVPCYALFKEVGDKLHLIYIFLYAYNGEYDILGLTNAGMHPADIEHMTLEFDKDHQTLLRVMYSAHGVKDGRWVPASKLPMEDGKIVGYMALNGHGLYPESGIAFRLGGVANDYLGRGDKWVPKPELIFLPDDPNFDIATMGWTAFNGRFGGEARRGNTDGIAPLLDKGWIRESDILNESELSPPFIFSETEGRIIITLKNIALFVIVYFIVYGILKFTDGYIFQPSDGVFGWREHLLTITLFMIVLAILHTGAVALIQKYVPS